MRFYAPRKVRRAPTRRAHRSSPRPVLESLEDRLVPSLAEGTILVATLPDRGFSTIDQSGFPVGLIGVDPVTGAQTQVSTGGLFSLPAYTVEAPNQQLFVVDLEAFGTGGIIGVDPNTGAQRLVAKGGFINGPNVLLYVDGYLYVADEGDASGIVHNIVRVDPNTGAQKLITDGSGRGFSVPVGVARGPGNSMYLADEPGRIQGTDPGKLWLVNLDTGLQTLVSSNNSSQGFLFSHPQDVIPDGAGNLFVLNGGNDGFGGNVIRVNAQTGVQSLVSFLSGPDRGGLDSMEFGSDGIIYVGAISYSSVPGRIYAVDPATGAQSIVAEDGQLSQVEGIRFFHVSVGSKAAIARNSAAVVTGQPSSPVDLDFGDVGLRSMQGPFVRPVFEKTDVSGTVHEISNSTPLNSAGKAGGRKTRKVDRLSERTSQEHLPRIGIGGSTVRLDETVDLPVGP